MDAGHQLPRAEGFGDIVVCAQVEAGHHAVFIPGSCEEDYWQACVGLDCPADSEAVAFRQGNIQEHQVIIRSGRLQERQRFFLPVYGGNGEAFFL